MADEPVQSTKLSWLFCCCLPGSGREVGPQGLQVDEWLAIY
jgi:hypothetical protein